MSMLALVYYSWSKPLKRDFSRRFSPSRGVHSPAQRWELRGGGAGDGAGT